MVVESNWFHVGFNVATQNNLGCIIYHLELWWRNCNSGFTPLKISFQCIHIHMRARNIVKKLLYSRSMKLEWGMRVIVLRGYGVWMRVSLQSYSQYLREEVEEHSKLLTMFERTLFFRRFSEVWKSSDSKGP